MWMTLHTTHNTIVMALAATAWLAGSGQAAAQDFGTEVLNVAAVSYSISGVDTSILTNEVVFTIEPPLTPAVIEFFRYAPTAASPITRMINGSAFSPSGNLDGPFQSVGGAITAGGTQIDLSSPIPLIEASTYLAGELMLVRVMDKGQNRNSNNIDTLAITVESDNGDVVILQLYESSPDSGEFWGYMQSSPNATAIHDPVLTTGDNVSLTATYADEFDETDVRVDTAIVNPLNRVFSSVTGEAIDGAIVTLIDLDTGQEAVVFGVDGFSAFPSEVTSGTDVSDEAGLFYDVDTGEFRFPNLPAGRYAVDVEAPEGFRFASVVSPDDLSAIGTGGNNSPGGPGAIGFVITPASFGQEIILESGGPLRFDIPLDPETDLVVTKVADRELADIGDFVNYSVSVENRGAAASPVVIHDTLPIGFRYIPGTSRTALERLDDPQVSETATFLTFPMGTIAPGETITIDYALEIGPGAALGDAVNEAVVRDNDGEQISNIARVGVTLREDLLRSTSTIVGRISELSCDGDEEWARHVTQGVGVGGVRLYMETGAYAVSDPDGLYHFEGVREGTHVVQVDKETLPKGFELMECEDTTRYAGSIQSQFVDVQGGGIWRANFYLKQVGAREEVIEEESFNDSTEYKDFDVNWLSTQTAEPELVYPNPALTPSRPSINIGIKHGPGQRVALSLNGKPVPVLNYVGREGSKDRSVMISRWRGVDLLGGRNELVAQIQHANGQTIKTIREDISFVKNIARVRGLPDQSKLIADGRTVPEIALRLEDEAGRPVHAGRITTIDLEPPYSLFDATGNSRLREQTQDLITPFSARQDFAVGAGGILKVKLEPTLRTGKVTVIATLENGRKVPIYMYLEPEKRDWILVGLAEGSVGYDDISGNAIALGEAEGKDVITDGRVAFFAKGLVKGNWLLTLSVDTDKERGNVDGDFLGEIDPNAYYTLYGDRSYQEFEGVSRYPLYIKLEKRQAYAVFGDYNTDITEGRLTSYNRRLSGLKGEYLGENIQVLGFAAETNQGFAMDEIAADGTSGTYQLSNDRILAQSEEIVIETRDRFRPDIVLDSKVMVRFLDYTLDYFTGELIFSQPVDVSDENFNPNVIVVNYETSQDAERNITYGGRVQTQLLGDRLQVGSTFVHEDGSSLVGGTEQNQVGIDVIAQVTDSTQIRAEYAITDNRGTIAGGTSQAILAEVLHTSENLQAEAYYREEEAGYGLNQTGSNTNGVRRYGVSADYRFDEFELESNGGRGQRHIEAQAIREENLTTGNARNTADVLVSQQGDRLKVSAGLRASEDELVNSEDRQSLAAIGSASLRLPNLGATVKLSHEQPLGGDDDVSAYPQRTTIGLDKRLGDKATLVARHEIIDGPNSGNQNTSLGITAQPWQGNTVTAASDLLTSDSARRLGATVGLDQNVKLSKHWSASVGLRNRRVLDSDGSFIEVAPDDAISPVEINDDFTSAYIGAAYIDGVMSASSRVETRHSSSGDVWTSSAAVVRELSEELSLAGSARAVVNKPKDNNKSSQIDVRLGGAWRPRDEDTIIFDRLDIHHDKNTFGERETRIVNNLAVNTQIMDRLQATTNYGVKHVRTEIADQTLKSWTHLIGAEARFDVTEKIDIGLRGSYLSSTTNTAKYSIGPSVGVNPVKNVWVSAGYNVAGFKDDDFQAAEYSHKGAYIQLRLKFDQDTASGLLRSISPRAPIAKAAPITQTFFEPGPTTQKVAPDVLKQETFLCDDAQTFMTDIAFCPIEEVPAPAMNEAPVVQLTIAAAPIARPDRATTISPQNLNKCESSNVAIFSVPAEAIPKQLTRLGTMPQFGDSHGLTPIEFYEKLKFRHETIEKDREYLDYLFRSMGYRDGFAAARPFMFSEDVLPVGTAGIMGLGKDHHYEYSILPSTERERQAFHVMSANGKNVHFMKTCGNYFYGCDAA